MPPISYPEEGTAGETMLQALKPDKINFPKAVLTSKSEQEGVSIGSIYAKQN